MNLAVKTEAPANLDLQTKVIVACARWVLPWLIVDKVLNSLNLPNCNSNLNREMDLSTE